MDVSQCLPLSASREREKGHSRHHTQCTKVCCRPRRGITPNNKQILPLHYQPGISHSGASERRVPPPALEGEREVISQIEQTNTYSLFSQRWDSGGISRLQDLYPSLKGDKESEGCFFPVLLQHPPFQACAAGILHTEIWRWQPASCSWTWSTPAERRSGTSVVAWPEFPGQLFSKPFLLHSSRTEKCNCVLLIEHKAVSARPNTFLSSRHQCNHMCVSVLSPEQIGRFVLVKGRRCARSLFGKF